MTREERGEEVRGAYREVCLRRRRVPHARRAPTTVGRLRPRWPPPPRPASPPPPAGPAPASAAGPAPAFAPCWLLPPRGRGRGHLRRGRGRGHLVASAAARRHLVGRPRKTLSVALFDATRRHLVGRSHLSLVRESRGFIYYMENYPHISNNLSLAQR